MFKQTKKKAADLAKELKREIKMLEAELGHKKQLLATLGELDRKTPFGFRRGPGRPAGTRPKASVAMRGRPAGRTKRPVRRKSKNRDIVLDAAKKLKGRFSLADLRNEILKKEPKFGGKYASGTILAVLKNTPEVKKIGRGTYKLTGGRRK